MSSIPKHRYSRVFNGDGQDPQQTKKNPSNRDTFHFNLILITSCLFAGLVGFFIAQAGCKIVKGATSELELRTLDHTFNYNRSFSYAPSNHTDRSWRAIFPLEGGFFIHPTIAPTRSTFSVFHQLHCLVSSCHDLSDQLNADYAIQDNMRRAYWANHDAAVAGHKLTDEDVHVDIGPSHVRHCTELLRQSLMCHADTTIEVVDEEINGVHGFRTEHQCKDWNQLVQWTSEQQRRQHVEQIVRA